MEMKMVTLLKVSLLLAVAAATSPEDPEGSARARGPIKHAGPEAGRKPFLYGRRFELPKDSKEDAKGELYSPLIITPIRALPSNNTDEETLKQNQNEIFTSIRDFMKEKTEENVRKTFIEDTSAKSSGRTETTTAIPPEGSNSTASRSRENGDRSLLVVLPFKAEEDKVEELFTKSPLVKMIEDDELDNRQGTTTVREREIIPTTEQNVVTRKRWRPLHRFRTTTEVSTTTERVDDVTKTYTNYDDVELVTRKFENPAGEQQNFTNHNYDDFTTNPIYKRFRNKTKKPEEREADTTEDFVPSPSTEKPKIFKPKLKRKGQRRKPSTEGPPKPEEVAKILDILPADVKDLVLQMGLNKDNNEQQGSGNNFRLERPPQPTIDPMSYAVFKPLPLEGQNENRNFVPDDMKDFLASFGLLPIGGRMQKSLKVETTVKPTSNNDLSDVNLDFLPDDLKSLLEEMGLVKPENKKEPTRIHIFNPSNHSIAHSEEDFEKLNAILSSIKSTVNKSESLTPEKQSEIIEKIKDLNNLRYKNGNLSEINNEIKKIVIEDKISDAKLRVTSKRATKLNEGPDPVMFSDESLLKNDVKRQKNSTNTSASSASSSASSASSSASSAASSASGVSSSASSSAASSSDSVDTSASASSASGSEGDAQTTTEEAPNIEALKESFGGGETAADDADIESSLPPKRPNGLYLLLDWNSFLEVGTEDDNRRVNLRFQPKIGDSRNFLPVSVP